MSKQSDEEFKSKIKQPDDKLYKNAILKKTKKVTFTTNYDKKVEIYKVEYQKKLLEDEIDQIKDILSNIRNIVETKSPVTAIEFTSLLSEEYVEIK